VKCLIYKLFVVYGKIYVLRWVAVIAIVLWLLKNQIYFTFGIT